MTPVYPFSGEELNKAYEEWGCSCGPSALAFALQRPLEDVRHAIPGFEGKGYASPTMMQNALAEFGITQKHPPRLRHTISTMFDPHMALVRIQFCGPWTAPGANAKWAYTRTHWIATWKDGEQRMLFDCNGGIDTFENWEMEIVPLLTKNIKRADGKWFPTHIWRIVK